GLRILYRGLDEEGLTDWMETWEEYEQLPVQVSIEIASDDGGTWPPMVVALPQAGTMPQLNSGRSRLAPRVQPGTRGGLRPGTRPGAGSGRNRLRDFPGRR